MFASFTLATYVQIAININVHVYKSSYDCVDLHIFAPSQSASSTHNAHHEQHFPCHHTTEEQTYCSGTIIYCGVCVCRAAAALSASPQVTNSVHRVKGH